MCDLRPFPRDCAGRQKSQPKFGLDAERPNASDPAKQSLAGPTGVLTLPVRYSDLVLQLRNTFILSAIVSQVIEARRDGVNFCKRR